MFSSSGGDGHNCHELCQALSLEGREISPTRFANSVHNAAAGYWSIGTGAMAESNVLCAFDASFSAGLLEAMTQVAVDQVPVLLVAYDSEYPQPLHAKRPIPDAFGVAMVLTPQRRGSTVARLDAALSDLRRRSIRRPGPRDIALRDSGGALAAVVAPTGGGNAGTSDSRVSRRITHASASRTMRLDRTWIERNIPHHGRMCLLDEVIEWDAHHICCRSSTHRALDHPLRSHGRLGIACGIEYAAQAMAAHGALAGGAGNPRSELGFLASLREVRLHVLRLDDIETDLISQAELIAGDRGSALYEFALTVRARRLLSGRATVVFDANKRFNP